MPPPPRFIKISEGIPVTVRDRRRFIHCKRRFRLLLSARIVSEFRSEKRNRKMFGEQIKQTGYLIVLMITFPLICMAIHILERMHREQPAEESWDWEPGNEER